MGVGIARMAGRALLAALRPFSRRKLPPQPDAVIRRILVLRFGGIGDGIALTALTRALRLRYPEAHIAVATVPSCAPIFEHNPDIDEILISEPMRATADPAALLARIAQLRRWSRAGYDVAVFAHNPFADLVLAPFLRARFKVGFETNDRGFGFGLSHVVRRYGTDHPKSAAQPRTHVIEHFLDLLRAFAGAVPSVPARVVVTEEETRAARAWLAAQGITSAPIVLAPGGTVAIKLWPIARFAELARRCAAELGVPVVIIGGPDEACHAPHFAALGPRVRFAAGALSLRQSMALISEAAALVASDTGLAHAAAALDVPLVEVFGPTPDWVYGYSGARRAVVKAALPCVPCVSDACRLLPAGTRGAVPPCMDSIGPDEVMAELARVVGAGARVAGSA